MTNNKMLKLVLPLPVSINALYTNQFTWNAKLKMRLPTGGRILSKEGEKVKKEIIEQTQKQMLKQDWDYEYTKTHYLYIDSIIYFNRKGRDESNLTKLMNDSLEKIVYDNDSRVLSRAQRIYYDKENPRVEVTIFPVEYVGIFDNKDQADNFIQNNCINCSRYKNNCSILKDSLESVIREEINNDLTCSAFKQIKNKKM